MTQSEIRNQIKRATGQDHLNNITEETYDDLQQGFTGDDENPAFILDMASNAILGMIAKGEINIQDLAKRTLESRGYDEDGNWVGFKS